MCPCLRDLPVAGAPTPRARRRSRSRRHWRDPGRFRKVSVALQSQVAERMVGSSRMCPVTIRHDRGTPHLSGERDTRRDQPQRCFALSAHEHRCRLASPASSARRNRQLLYLDAVTTVEIAVAAQDRKISRLRKWHCSSTRLPLRHLETGDNARSRGQRPGALQLSRSCPSSGTAWSASTRAKKNTRRV